MTGSENAAMAQHFKISDTLSSEHRQEFEALARDPKTTIDGLLEWLSAHGYQIGRSSVGRWKKDFNQTLQDVKTTAEMASALGSAVRQGGMSQLNDAILGRVQQLQLQWALSQLDGGDLTPEDLERIGKALNHTTQAAQRNEDLRETVSAQMAKLETKVKTGGVITAADLADARKAVFG
jgi:hypothetical protein